ncbi:MAG: short-chain fatty acyl-CoA regulator family protein [Pseudomonadota bacterium]
MKNRKRFAGPRLREIRQSLGLTQTAFAKGLGVSLSYLNQMERNHRPLSRTALIGLAETYGVDIAALDTDESARLAADLREALSDPLFDEAPGMADIEVLAANAPKLAHAFLQLHRAHAQANERLAALDDRIGREDSALTPSPWEEVRDFFHYCDNYVDAVDHAAERFADRANVESDKPAALARWLDDRHGIQMRIEGDAVRRFDAEARVISLSRHAGAETHAFHLAHQIALIDQAELIEATLDLANFRTDEARAICKIGLANYFAGAAIMPYRRFLEAASDARHDIELLAEAFGASLEQVCHRLSTLQRPEAKGVPFYFLRVDQAGTITKRHSATRLQFARYGGACPLWNVHQAFETPGRIIRQLAETPDGGRYLCLATDVTKRAGAFRAPVRRYAIGLGCEVAHADQMVYADDLDVARDAAFQPIGVSCRICERRDCHQRSVPPLEKALVVDHDARGVLPYAIRR